MKRLLGLTFTSAWALIVLSSCGENHSDPDYNPAVGPFDSNGNYVEAWADNPPKSRRARNRGTNPKPSAKPKETPKPKAIPKPQRKVMPTQAPTPKPKPKPVKVKPKTIRHTVVKGDTLWGLSRKYGSSVSKIQKANGLNGTKIINGKTLVIPR